jgi:hypothetical protein
VNDLATHFFCTVYYFWGEILPLGDQKKKKGPITTTKDFMKKNPPNLPHV